jgi:hypothetical protein
MKRQAAETLLQDILALTAQLNVVAARIEDVTPAAELHAMRRHVASVMAACDEHLFRPILREHPDLEPHR